MSTDTPLTCGNVESYPRFERPGDRYVSDETAQLAELAPSSAQLQPSSATAA